jgi:hypothetical protein
MRSRAYLPSLGLLSLILYFALTVLSKEFNWGEGYTDRPILEYLALYFSLFVLYALACIYVFKTPWSQATFWILVICGLLFRSATLPSQQIQEDDVYRYLWDGKVFAHGINPFEYAPEEINDYKMFKINNPESFRALYDERNQEELALLHKLKWDNDTALTFMERINHPHVATLYPPLAQYVFRLVHNIHPDSILAMRSIFLAFDLIAMVFIVVTLHALGLNRNYSLVYFWSPLIIKETFNSTHLDIIGISCLCVSIYFLVRKHMAWSIFFLALSVLGKIYSGILLPFYLQRSWLIERKHAKSGWTGPVLHLSMFCMVLVLGYLPFVDIGWKAFEGLQTYSTQWQSNDSLFALLLYFLNDILQLGGKVIPVFGNSMILAKGIVFLVSVSVVSYMLIRKIPDPDASSEWVRNLFMAMVLVFLVSPVQNPWYLCWSVPFLCLFHWRSFILLTGLVGLYYLDFYFDYQEITQYSTWIPWIEYAPFYLYLIWELKNRPAQEGVLKNG